MALKACDIALRAFGIVLIVVDFVLGVQGYIGLAKEETVISSNTRTESMTEHVCEKQHTISCVFLGFFIFGGLGNAYQIILYILEFCICEKLHRGFPLGFTIVAYLSASAMSICVIVFNTRCRCKGNISFGTSQLTQEVFRGVFRLVLVCVSDIIKCCRATKDCCSIQWDDCNDGCITVAHAVSLFCFFICFLAELVFIFSKC